MSKKKSYMNRENVLSEGFFDKISKGLFKLIKNTKDKRKAKQGWKLVDKKFKEAEQAGREWGDEIGVDYDELIQKMKDMKV